MDGRCTLDGAAVSPRNGSEPMRGEPASLFPGELGKKPSASLHQTFTSRELRSVRNCR